MNKHFVSVLGTGGYTNTIYYCGEDRYETPYIQEALLKLKFTEWNPGDKITVFLTEQAKNSNWEDRAYTEREIQAAKEKGETLPEKKIGLKNVLMKEYAEYLDDVELCMVPIGATQEELWTIFQVIFERISEGEELYIDITHALRNIPIQMLAVISYARVIKNIQVNGIYYGAFEVGVPNAQGIKETPVMDLLTFLDILDWSQAANAFVKYGNSDQIAELYEQQKDRAAIRKTELNKLIKEIQNITHGLETSRGYFNETNGAQNKNGKSILESYRQYLETYRIMSTKDSRLEERNQKQKTMIEPLGELLNVIDQKVARFHVNTNLELGIAAVEWAIENKRTQQGFTALEETVKTFMCNHYGFNECEELYRDKICKNISILLYQAINVKEGGLVSEEMRKNLLEEWMTERGNELISKSKQKETDEEHIKEVFMSLPESLMMLCHEIGDCRNTMNHFGYSNQGKYSCSLLETKLEEYYKEFCKIMQEMMKPTESQGAKDE